MSQLDVITGVMCTDEAVASRALVLLSRLTTEASFAQLVVASGALQTLATMAVDNGDFKSVRLHVCANVYACSVRTCVILNLKSMCAHVCVHVYMYNHFLMHAFCVCFGVCLCL